MVVYTLELGFAKCVCDRLTEDTDFGKKIHLFRWSSFWSRRVCKQPKFSHLGHKKPARVYWKTDAPKTSHCLLRVLVQRHYWAIFLQKWARRGHYSQWWSLSGHVKRLLFTKIEEEDIGNIWFQQYGATSHKAETTLDVLRPVFEDRIISRRADVVWQLRSCDLIPLNYYLWSAVKDKCYADKAEIIDA